MDFLSLNNEQLKAAQHHEGAVLVTAGAGSGKTRLLTYRIAALVEKGVKPSRILAITFTNKAANEMKQRLEKMIPDINYMWVTTFHSMCARILRKNIDRLGYSLNFTIYADAEQERVLKKIFDNLNADADKYLKLCKDLISKAKSVGLGCDSFEEEYSDISNIELIAKIFREYEKYLKTSNALDFEDLLFKTKQLFVEYPEVLDYYADKWQYINVDEFQDTNKIQYELVKLLGSKHKNIFIVGDEDQSIYGWRGANIENISNFAQEFNATIYKLEQNYRSTSKILTAANNLIKNNKTRIPKTLWTENEEGVKIEKFFASYETDEAEYVAMAIKSLMEYSNHKYSDFAILVRLNAITRIFEEKLLNYNIPYNVYGGFKFYDRKEIKDLIAYMRIISNPNDNEAILRVINFPKRGIGEAAIKTLEQLAYYKGVSLYSLLENLQDLDELTPTFIRKITPFAKIIKDLKEYSRNHSISQFVKKIIERTGMAVLYSENTEENLNRRLNIEQFINSVEEFEQNNTDADISKFLESVSLISESDTSDDGDKVTLATVHSAKGLEFPVVFVVGLEEGIFPVKRDGECDIEEERRLMYVAVTRAERRLYLTCSRKRIRYGSIKDCLPSRFLTEVDGEEAVEKAFNSYNERFDRRLEDDYSYSYQDNNYRSNNYYSRSDNYYKYDNYYKNDNYYKRDNDYKRYNKYESSSEKRVVTTAKTIEKQTKTNIYQEGMRVRHKVYGEGIIRSIENASSYSTAKIEFEKAGMKNMSLEFTPLEIISND